MTTKRTVALSYAFVFLVGMIFANSLRSNHPIKGLLWLDILAVILSAQLQPVSPRVRKSLIAVQSALCATTVALLVVFLRG
jgi:hypothetical protein